MIQSRTLLICVHSAATNARERRNIRETWGDPRSYDSDLVLVPRIIFILGLPVDRHGNASNYGAKEHEAHGDILLFDFDDSYYNLTLKGLSTMRWIEKTLPDVTHILKADDDILLNPFYWITKIRSLPPPYRNAARPCFMGKVWSGAVVKREGKWKTGVNSYSHAVYPSYCNGPNYYFNREAMLRVLRHATTAPLFHLEDVFFSGFMASEAGIPRVEVFQETEHVVSDLLKRKIQNPRGELFLCLTTSEYKKVHWPKAWRDIVAHRMRYLKEDERMSYDSFMLLL